MVVNTAVNYTEIMDDMGLKNQWARRAAQRYVEKLIAEGMDESQIETQLGAYYDGYMQK